MNSGRPAARPSCISLNASINFREGNLLQVPSPQCDTSSNNDDQLSLPRLSPADYKPFERWRLSPRDGEGINPPGVDYKWNGRSIVNDDEFNKALNNADDDDCDDNDDDSGNWVPTGNQPFNMRLVNLSNITQSLTVNRSNYRAQSMSCVRAKMGSVQNTAKSLDLMRQILQKSINKEIDVILQKYMKTYFEPALANIRLNNGAQSVSTEHILTVCRQILEECKSMYSGDVLRSAATPEMPEASGGDWVLEHKAVRAIREGRKRRVSSGSESSANTVKQGKKGRRQLGQPSSNRSTPSRTIKADVVKKEGPSWDADRLKTDTLFVMGAKANKALGLGATRGRIYVKHPEIFKYAGDQDDKQWLHENQLMPATGGRSYVLIVDDIKELASTDEYRNSSGLLLGELKGFTVPEWMLDKMKAQMRSQRTETSKSTPLLTSPLAQASPATSVDNADDDEVDDNEDNQRGNSPLNSTGGFLVQEDFPQLTNHQTDLLETSVDSNAGFEESVMTELEDDKQENLLFSQYHVSTESTEQVPKASTELEKRLMLGLQADSSRILPVSIWNRVGHSLSGFPTGEGANISASGAQRGYIMPVLGSEGATARSGSIENKSPGCRFEFDDYGKR